MPRHQLCTGISPIAAASTITATRRSPTCAWKGAVLLRELSAQAIAVSQLAGLQGAAAPASLVRLIEELSLQLTNAEVQQQLQLTEVFYNRLTQELRLMLGQPSASHANSAGHVCLAIEWLLPWLSEPISMKQLANALGLTPRSVQACFKSVLTISPMNWLKLARIGKLRQLLCCGDMKSFSIQELMSCCGLSDSSLNRQHYKNSYGVSPTEEQRQAEATKRQCRAVNRDSQYYQFDNMQAAIQYLEKIKQFE